MDVVERFRFNGEKRENIKRRGKKTLVPGQPSPERAVIGDFVERAVIGDFVGGKGAKKGGGEEKRKNGENLWQQGSHLPEGAVVGNFVGLTVVRARQLPTCLP
jgi:hypothetical protein